MAKSSWQYMIGSTHTNSYNNGILHMHIICPIKINHLSLHQLSKKLWTTFKINNIILNIQRGAKNHHAYKNTSTFCFSIMTHSRTRLVVICLLAFYPCYAPNGYFYKIKISLYTYKFKYILFYHLYNFIT